MENVEEKENELEDFDELFHDKIVGRFNVFIYYFHYEN